MARTLEASRRSAIRERVLHEMSRLPERIGRYEVRGELGRGGMGIVYDAYDPELRRTVAVKTIDPERLRGGADAAARFEREMRATSETFHENLVAILDAGMSEEPSGTQAYYVMERVVGPSLEERLQSSGPLPRREALGVAAGIARGLAAAHAAGLVHRDLKLANVLLPLKGGVKVADFGLCNLRDEPDIPSPDTMLGSAHSIAPEQVRGLTVSASADLFALGTILVRMLTGAEPFAAADLESHLYRVVHDPPDGLDALDPDIAALVRPLLSKDPDARPSDAEAVAEQLESLADRPAPRPHLFGGVGGGEGPWPPRRMTLPAGLAIAGALVLLLGGTLVLAHNQLAGLEHEIATRWSQVENQLARQHELVPRLVEVARHQAGVEGARVELLLASLDAPQRGAPPERAAADALRTLQALSLAARSLALGSDAHWRDLSFEIAGTKNRIAVERARYNAAVGRYNRRLEQLPWRLLAPGRERRGYFEPEASALGEPVLDL